MLSPEAKSYTAVTGFLGRPDSSLASGKHKIESANRSGKTKSKA